jgi:RNA polymerase sigma-70 factor (ECF subfamily)
MNASSTSFQSTGFHPAVGAGAVAWNEMVSHRGYLVRFAQRKLHDPMRAEDVVHDVFEAVISGRASFAGRSALRSWLTAILKNKIVDLVRSRAVYDSLDADCGDDADSHGVMAIECPHAQPDELAEQRQVLAATLERIDALPAGLRDVMHLRVIQDQPTEEVCAALAISEDNLFVRLHRARKQLLASAH